jgi:hypothetical protein
MNPAAWTGRQSRLLLHSLLIPATLIRARSSRPPPIIASCQIGIRMRSPSTPDSVLRRAPVTVATGSAGRNGRFSLAEAGGHQVMGPSCFPKTEPLAEFRFRRMPACDAIERRSPNCKHAGILVQLVSGDREAAVAPIARQLGIPFRSPVLPAGKITHIKRA